MRRTVPVPLDPQKVKLHIVLDNVKELKDTATKSKRAYNEYYGRLTNPKKRRFNTLFRSEVHNLKPESGELMLAPVNWILWLYELGNTDDKLASRVLYTTIAARVKEIRKMPRKTDFIRLEDTPLTNRGKELLSNYAMELAKSKHRTFNSLQMLITALSYVVMGRSATTPSKLVHEVFSVAAPLLPLGIRPCPGQDVPAYILTYSELSRPVNSQLLVMAKAAPLCLLLHYLIERLGPIGPRDSDVLSRPEMCARLLAILNVSRGRDAEEVFKKSAVISNNYIWR